MDHQELTGSPIRLIDTLAHLRMALSCASQQKWAADFRLCPADARENTLC